MQGPLAPNSKLQEAVKLFEGHIHGSGAPPASLLVLGLVTFQASVMPSALKCRP